jgi:N-ethylmaleimide reductase
MPNKSLQATGVIIGEGTAISPEGFGWADSPGLWSKEQVAGWIIVANAVHEAGGRIIAQLWHTGSMSHPELLDGATPVSVTCFKSQSCSRLRRVIGFLAHQ